MLDICAGPMVSRRRFGCNLPVTGLHRYSIYGLDVASEEPLMSLEAKRWADTDAAIAISFVLPDYFRTIAPNTGPRPDDWIVHAVLPDRRVYLKADGIFEAVISADGRSVACAALGQVDRRSFEANLMNFVLSTALTLQGEEPLHSTVVDLGGRAVGLLGPSGAGKSTLAAYLIGAGADLVTDDMLRVEFADGALLAHPGPYRLKLLDEPGRRLLPEAFADGHFNTLTGKMMMRPRISRKMPFAAVPLAGLFFLGSLPEWPQSDAVSSVRLTGLELAKVIISSSMEDRYDDARRLARQLAFAERLARSLPIYALRYPRSFDVMEQVAAEIRRVIGA
jgi:hypothetical protein